MIIVSFLGRCPLFAHYYDLLTYLSTHLHKKTYTRYLPLTSFQSPTRTAAICRVSSILCKIRLRGDSEFSESAFHMSNPSKGPFKYYVSMLQPCSISSLTL